MADDKDILAERGRSLEADYFRRKDRELLERAREREAAAQRCRHLGEVLGIDANDPVSTGLSALEFDGGTVPLLEIVPAIQVAWADGTLPPRERREIERLLARPNLQEAAALGSAMVEQWLARQPGCDLYRLATDALRLRASRLAADERKRLVGQILADCNAVAAASGGVFGLGALSSAEANSIRELATTLGVKS